MQVYVLRNITGTLHRTRNGRLKPNQRLMDEMLQIGQPCRPWSHYTDQGQGQGRYDFAAQGQWIVMTQNVVYIIGLNSE